MEQKVNNLSNYCSLIVGDGNRLHNEMEDIYLSNSYLTKKIETLANSIHSLQKCVSGMEANYTAMEEALNNQICNLQKAEIELSNRLEMLRLETKGSRKKENISSDMP
ncbi:MAG: hypothetical protein E3K37_03700 [Candidatus Kuenenia sp.]|nr:hypothetical protein [Candidatus Kuenenia hertensis]